MSAPLPARTNDARVWGYFVALSLIWGSSFVFIKTALDEGMGPFSLVAVRVAIASLFLGLLVVVTRGRVPRTRQALGRLTVLAVFNIAVPFVLIHWGAQHNPSAVTSIFNGTVPLFAIIIAAFVLHDEPVTLNRLGGLLLGFCGAVLLASPNLGTGSGSHDPTQALLGELAVLAGSLSYAAATVYAKRSITGRALIRGADGQMRTGTPVEISFAQVALALPFVLLFAVLVERPSGGLVALPPSAAAWISVLWLGILGSGVAYLCFFRIVRAWGATRTTLVTYVIPVVGIALGVIVLGEALEPVEVAGASLIIGGVVLVNSRFGRRRLFGRAMAG